MASFSRKVSWLAQFFLVVVFVLCNKSSMFALCHEFKLVEQANALLALKSGLMDSGGYLSDWKYQSNASNGSFMTHIPCSWNGITCNKARVIALDLSNKNLTGLIKQDIQKLSHLVSLNLSNNSFSGSLPEAIFNLSKLKSVDLSHNYFNGSFPKSVAALEELESFTAYSNSFTGPLPQEFGQLKNLRVLHLGGSYFSGNIPPEYCEVRALEFLNLAGNAISGLIPPQLGKLQNLRHLEIGYNSFRGEIPQQIGNLSKLEYLDISSANLSGSVPAVLGKLQRLNSLFLFKNQLTGSIPQQLANMTALESLDLSFNLLTGGLPEGLSRLEKLTRLSVMCNTLSGRIPAGIAGLPKLRVLEIWNNFFTGRLPAQLGRNSSIEWLDASSNQLTGPIPVQLCAGNALFKLMLFSNQLSGEIPPSLANCSTLWRFRIAKNNLNGRIPTGFGRLQNFSFMDVSHNKLAGPLPSDLCNSPRLEYINVSYNSFHGGLPPKIWASPSLQLFSAASANLSGTLPNFTGCSMIYQIELQGNSISGKIPSDIGACKKLVMIKLNRNHLSGEIPVELASLPSINGIDLSHNDLRGAIPSKLENCRTLEYFNVSSNRLSGPVPSEGIFKNISSTVFADNSGLCGGVLIGSPCIDSNSIYPFPSTDYPAATKKSSLLVVWIVGGMFIVAAFFIAIMLRSLHKRYKWSICGERYVRHEHDQEGPWRMTAFQRLSFTVEDVLDCLKSSNIVGMGAAGTVYRADMPGGEVIAVKKLWRMDKDSGRHKKKVLSEVDVLGNVRHRNIVKLLGCCSNNEDTLLLYEYMPNGSLADLLHGKKETKMLVADWMTRYNIAVGVAEGLCYLHQDCHPVIVHRDVKPSNILLDANMNARVADFGVAKLIQTGSESMSIIAGSYGYIAPEFAYTLQVQEKSDVYSFGVVLLELVTGKRPMEAEFGDALNIVDWVRSKVQTKEGAAQVLDQSVGGSCSSIQEEMLLVLRIALLCTSRSPADRPSMRDVVSMLSEAKPRRKQPSLPDLRSPNPKRDPAPQESSPTSVL